MSLEEPLGIPTLGSWAVQTLPSQLCSSGQGVWEHSGCILKTPGSPKTILAAFFNHSCVGVKPAGHTDNRKCLFQLFHLELNQPPGTVCSMRPWNIWGLMSILLVREAQNNSRWKGLGRSEQGSCKLSPGCSFTTPFQWIFFFFYQEVIPRCSSPVGSPSPYLREPRSGHSC